ncbi:membrane-bound alkaline phosphatase-like [Bradysia coprophila]|uniref:membrane-bound alkaline phosphatase-like n=1 Tax=Bradysia coprophila TaxID=38358 RepID=UPI00187DB66F|nr:membrane-bound alkaline phosphatase-like [Bradysia coprophila]
MQFWTKNSLQVIVFILLNYIVSGNTRPDDAFEIHSNPYRDNEASSHRTKRSSAQDHNTENEEFFWNFGAQLTLQDRLSIQMNRNIAKNIILFIGDGMSLSTVAAARTYLGQLQGNTGEETTLSFEEFPNIGLSKTYSVDEQIADSAATANAYLCGVKTNSATIGVTGRVKKNDCFAANNSKNRLTSIARWAQRSGKSTGIVTTTRITHASPAASYANVANRDYECDADVMKYNQDPVECGDIAAQLINGPTGREFNVILGGGRSKFLPIDECDEDGKRGQRLDGLNLIDEWRMEKESIGGVYVHNRSGLVSCDFNKTTFLLGLFASDHLDYHLEANHDKQPTLAEMTEAAIKILSKNKNGFFLFVEGGRIDHAHHSTQSRKALDETVQLAEAVRVATELTDSSDTLIVTTSDHSHTMTMSGYSSRGNDILGLSTSLGGDKLKYSTLSYANGQRNYMTSSGTRLDLTKLDMEDPNFHFPSMVPLSSETHAGEDVAIYASGPWSHLFSCVMEQNVIPHMMAYASCVGDKLTACKKNYKEQRQK